jgi:hypothetical protein
MSEEAEFKAAVEFVENRNIPVISNIRSIHFCDFVLAANAKGVTYSNDTKLQVIRSGRR